MADDVLAEWLAVVQAQIRKMNSEHWPFGSARCLGIITAVAPLIAKAERERCARVADARYAHHKAVAQEACFGRPQKLVLLSFSQSNYAEAEHIAAAIRAMPDESAV